MKKITLIAAAAALLLSGGVFVKTMTTNDSLSERNIAALTQSPDDGEGENGQTNGANIYNDFPGPCELSLDGISLNAQGIESLIGIKIANQSLSISAEGKLIYGTYHNCVSGGTSTCTPVTCEQLLAAWAVVINAIRGK